MKISPETLEQILKTIYKAAYNETAPENIELLRGSLHYSEETIVGFAILAEDKLITIVLANENDDVFGPIVDLLKKLEYRTAVSLNQKKSKYSFNSSDAILLLPTGFYDDEKKWETYYAPSYLPSGTVSPEEIESIGLKKTYTYYNLELMPELKKSSEYLLELMNQAYKEPRIINLLKGWFYKFFK